MTPLRVLSDGFRPVPALLEQLLDDGVGGGLSEHAALPFELEKAQRGPDQQAIDAALVRAGRRYRGEAGNHTCDAATAVVCLQIDVHRRSEDGIRRDGLERFDQRFEREAL